MFIGGVFPLLLLSAFALGNQEYETLQSGYHNVKAGTYYFTFTVKPFSAAKNSFIDVRSVQSGDTAPATSFRLCASLYKNMDSCELYNSYTQEKSAYFDVIEYASDVPVYMKIEVTGDGDVSIFSFTGTLYSGYGTFTYGTLAAGQTTDVAYVICSETDDRKLHYSGNGDVTASFSFEGPGSTVDACEHEDELNNGECKIKYPADAFYPLILFARFTAGEAGVTALSVYDENKEGITNVVLETHQKDLSVPKFKGCHNAHKITIPANKNVVSYIITPDSGTHMLVSYANTPELPKDSQFMKSTFHQDISGDTAEKIVYLFTSPSETMCPHPNAMKFKQKGEGYELFVSEKTLFQTAGESSKFTFTAGETKRMAMDISDAPLPTEGFYEKASFKIRSVGATLKASNTDATLKQDTHEGVQREISKYDGTKQTAYEITTEADQDRRGEWFMELTAAAAGQVEFTTGVSYTLSADTKKRSFKSGSIGLNKNIYHHIELDMSKLNTAPGANGHVYIQTGAMYSTLPIYIYCDVGTNDLPDKDHYKWKNGRIDSPYSHLVDVTGHDFTGNDHVLYCSLYSSEIVTVNLDFLVSADASNILQDGGFDTDTVTGTGTNAISGVFLPSRASSGSVRGMSYCSSAIVPPMKCEPGQKFILQLSNNPDFKQDESDYGDKVVTDSFECNAVDSYLHTEFDTPVSGFIHWRVKSEGANADFSAQYVLRCGSFSTAYVPNDHFSQTLQLSMRPTQAAASYDLQENYLPAMTSIEVEAGRLARFDFTLLSNTQTDSIIVICPDDIAITPKYANPLCVSGRVSSNHKEYKYQLPNSDTTYTYFVSVFSMIADGSPTEAVNVQFDFDQATDIVVDRISALYLQGETTLHYTTLMEVRSKFDYIIQTRLYEIQSPVNQFTIEICTSTTQFNPTTECDIYHETAVITQGTTQKTFSKLWDVKQEEHQIRLYTTLKYTCIGCQPVQLYYSMEDIEHVTDQESFDISIIGQGMERTVFCLNYTKLDKQNGATILLVPKMQSWSRSDFYSTSMDVYGREDTEPESLTDSTVSATAHQGVLALTIPKGDISLHKYFIVIETSTPSQIPQNYTLYFIQDTDSVPHLYGEKDSPHAHFSALDVPTTKTQMFAVDLPNDPSQVIASIESCDVPLAAWLSPNYPVSTVEERKTDSVVYVAPTSSGIVHVPFSDQIFHDDSTGILAVRPPKSSAATNYSFEIFLNKPKIDEGMKFQFTYSKGDLTATFDSAAPLRGEPTKYTLYIMPKNTGNTLTACGWTHHGVALNDPVQFEDMEEKRIIKVTLAQIKKRFPAFNGKINSYQYGIVAEVGTGVSVSYGKFLFPSGPSAVVITGATFASIVLIGAVGFAAFFVYRKLAKKTHRTGYMSIDDAQPAEETNMA